MVSGKNGEKKNSEVDVDKKDIIKKIMRTTTN